MAVSRGLRFGDIVVVGQLLDPHGRNPKDRPCVVVMPTAAIVEDGRLDVVAITTKLPDPLPLDHVRLPWQNSRHPVTGLNKPNAAVCSWLDRVPPDRVMARIGMVPGRQLILIQSTLVRLRQS